MSREDGLGVKLKNQGKKSANQLSVLNLLVTTWNLSLPKLSQEHQHTDQDTLRCQVSKQEPRGHQYPHGGTKVPWRPW